MLLVFVMMVLACMCVHEELQHLESGVGLFSLA